jgi:hypothetical protein
MTPSGSIYLVSCVSKKQIRPSRARDLYCSAWFVKARAYVEGLDVQWFILSAKYGLVSPDEVVSPYEVTLNEMASEERRAWASRVATQLRPTSRKGTRVVILAGDSYRQYLVPIIKGWGCTVDVPMRGLGIGKQLQWLSRRGGPYERNKH